MIFREDYDKILLMMLKADKKGKEKIVEFLKEFPKELLLQLQEDLKNYQMDKRVTWSPSSEELYYYDIYSNEILTIGKFVGPLENRNCVFEIGIENAFAHGKKDIIEEEYLGYVTYEDPNSIVEYNVIKIPFFYILAALTEYHDDHDVSFSFGLSGKRNKNVSVEQLSGPTRKRTK